MPLSVPTYQLRFRLEFPTEKRYLDGTLLAVLRSLEDAIEACGATGGGKPPPAVDLERVRVALREALANAAEHGNKYREDRSIRVQGWADASGLGLEIEDEGDGFDVEGVQQQLAQEDVRRERGRGLRFMQGLSDELRFERGGSRVVLCFGRRPV